MTTTLPATSTPATARPLGTTPTTGNPTNARTTMVGGQAQFENDNYQVTMGDNNNIVVHNKHTGETYEVWGDPHVKVDGKNAFDFWGTTTLQLDDGTKLTIETTPWANDPNMTLASKVTITNGEYGVQVKGIDTNKTGDLTIEETQHGGAWLDLLVSDGNLLHENPNGSGFLGQKADGSLALVDQSYINATDLKKATALKDQAQQGLDAQSGILAFLIVGIFVSAMTGGSGLPGAESNPGTGGSLGEGESNPNGSSGFSITVTRHGGFTITFGDSPDQGSSSH